MQKITFLILLISSVILCPTKSHAQMQSLMTTSTKRVLNPATTAMTPVKSVAVNNKSIITAINYKYSLTGAQIMGAAFYLTNDDSNAASGPNYRAKVGHLPNFQITDMEIDRHEVFFCGTKNHVPFFAHTYLTNLINGGVVDIFMLPTMAEVFKIDVYKNTNGERKVSLIGYIGRYVFIDVNLASLQNKVYVMSSNIRLLDVRHGANTVAVLGQRENGKFALISHNRNDLQNYNGCLYQTPQLYLDDSVGNYHYLLEMYRDNLNDIAIVGYSGMDFSSGTNISLIQLSNMSVMHTQAVDSRKEVRSKFKDMRIDDFKRYLLCLIENPMTGVNDNIFVLDPMYSGSGSYTVNVAIPDTNTNANYFTSLAPYIGSASYVVLGKNNNSVTFFDKISSSYSNLNCAGQTSFRVDTIEKIEKLGSIYYEDINSLPMSHDTVNSASAIATYSIICQ